MLIFIMKVSAGLGYVISCSVHFMPSLIMMFYGPEMSGPMSLGIKSIVCHCRSAAGLMLVTHELSIHRLILVGKLNVPR
jgi:hypothetical protein